VKNKQKKSEIRGGESARERERERAEEEEEEEGMLIIL
jgi:hypothetical protein